MDKTALTIRRASSRDELAITTLVRSEHLNPIDLDWRRFVIAVDRGGVVGAVQLRRHPDDTRELGSLVVRRDAHGRGIAARLIDALLANAATRVLMITDAAFATHYARWGFRPIEPARAPRTVRFNYYFGQFVGGAMSLLAGRRPKRLAILEAERRLAAADARSERALRADCAARLYGSARSNTPVVVPSSTLNVVAKLSPISSISA